MNSKHQKIVMRVWLHVREALRELGRLPDDALGGCPAIELNPEVIPESRGALRQISDDLSFVVADVAIDRFHAKKQRKKARAA